MVTFRLAVVSVIQFFSRENDELMEKRLKISAPLWSYYLHFEVSGALSPHVLSMSKKPVIWLLILDTIEAKYQCRSREIMHSVASVRPFGRTLLFEHKDILHEVRQQ